MSSYQVGEGGRDGGRDGGASRPGEALRVEEQAFERRMLRSVQCVPADRVTCVRQVDADLVGAAGHEIELEQAGRLAAGEVAVADQANAGERWTTGADCHPPVIARVAADRAGQFSY